MVMVLLNKGELTEEFTLLHFVEDWYNPDKFYRNNDFKVLPNSTPCKNKKTNILLI